MLEIGRGFGGKRDLKQNMKICCLSNKTELNKDVERLLHLSPGDDDYVEDVWKSLNLSCSQYLNLSYAHYVSILFSPRRFIHPPLVPFSHQDLNTTKDIVGKGFEDLNPDLGVLLVQTLALNIFSTWSKFVLDLDLRSQLVVLLHDVVHVVLCNIGSLVRLLCSDSFVQHFFEAGFAEKIF